jgi:hypothetical protein
MKRRFIWLYFSLYSGIIPVPEIRIGESTGLGYNGPIGYHEI